MLLFIQISIQLTFLFFNAFNPQNVHTEISFFKTHAICIKMIHYDIDTLNGTVFIYGYDNETHSTQCLEPLLIPDPTDEANYLSDDAFCSDTNQSSYRVVDYLDFGVRNFTAASSFSTIVSADRHVINIFSLCCTIYYLLSYLLNRRHVRI